MGDNIKRCAVAVYIDLTGLGGAAASFASFITGKKKSSFAADVREKINKINFNEEFRKKGGVANCVSMWPPHKPIDKIGWSGNRITIEFEVAANITVIGVMKGIPTFLTNIVGKVQWIIDAVTPLVQTKINAALKESAASYVVKQVTFNVTDHGRIDYTQYENAIRGNMVRHTVNKMSDPEKLKTIEVGFEMMDMEAEMNSKFNGKKWVRDLKKNFPGYEWKIDELATPRKWR